MERRLWPSSSIAGTVACLVRMRLANRSLFQGEAGASSDSVGSSAAFSSTGSGVRRRKH